MNEPTNEPANAPPLVTRPEPEGAPALAPVPVPRRPRPGLIEAGLWCGVFLGTQLLCLIVVTSAAFVAHVYAHPEPRRFTDEQLAAVGKWAAKEPGAAIPAEFAQSLAWGMLASQVASLGLILLIVPRRVGPDWKRQLGVRPPRAIHVLLVLLVAPGFLLVPDLVQQAVQWATGAEPPSLREIPAIFAPFPWALTLLAVAVGPGVVEEFWFRGFLGRGLCARYGLGAGVLLSSLFFALAHMSPAMLLVYTLMGAYLHFVYLATRSIWPGVLLHALNNGIGISIMLAFPDAAGDTSVHPAVFLMAVALVCFGGVAFWTSRGELAPVRGAEGEPWVPESPRVSAPPAGANVRLAYAPVSPAALLFTVLSLGALVALAVQFSR
ncbi:MAG TPA: type II CAAX endopeptidase family protein [Gemmata sp.]